MHPPVSAYTPTHPPPPPPAPAGAFLRASRRRGRPVRACPYPARPLTARSRTGPGCAFAPQEARRAPQVLCGQMAQASAWIGRQRMSFDSLLDSDTQLNQKSYYEASVQRDPASAPLQGEVHADVLVVGAGFAGLSSAIELAQRGCRAGLLEADRVCSGASGRNGGQAIVGYASGLAPFEQQLGPDGARRAWDMSLEALDLIDERIAQFGIDCDRVDGYLYVATSARK